MVVSHPQSTRIQSYQTIADLTLVKIVPITPLKPGLTREQSDMGVRMALWSRSGNIFYSGSSDGIIKAWNINHSPSDVFLYDIAQLQAGVMCGAFSPDHSNLLVGDSRGAIHVLSSAPISTKEKEGCVEEIRLQRSEMVDKEDVPQAGENRGTEMRDAARELLESGELEMHPIYGAGKGPNYKGPFARYARPEGVDPIVNPILRPEIQAVQLSASQRALAGPAATVSRAERRNRKLMQDMAKVRNVTSEVEVVAWDDELGGGGERKRKRGEGKSLKGKERERSPLHHESDDDREIRFEELPETEDEGEGERRGLRSKREIEVIVID